MLPEDLDTVRRAYDAFARGDLETLRTFLASGRDSGVEVALPIFQVVAVRNGQLVRMHDFGNREDALEAVAQLQG